MENFSRLGKEDGQLELPPGFRFHPSDEELITHYLSKKVLDNGFSARAIGEVDMNKVEPWDLPWKAKMGEKEWYFFCVRDKKYPTGLRTNRATAAGYWKATGKDKEIFRAKSLVGMKKTLVFYKGRAPKGEKSNWVIHEYRLEGKFSLNLPKSAKNEWVICRVFHKSSGGKKVHISGLMRLNSITNDTIPPALPPLMDSSSYGTGTKPTVSGSFHVPCFSNSADAQNPQKEMTNYYNNPAYPFSPILSNISPRFSIPSSFSRGQSAPTTGNFQFSGTLPLQDQAILRGLLENYGSSMRQGLKTENEMVTASQETGLSTEMNTEITSVVSNLGMGRRSLYEHDAPSTSVGPLDLDYLWSC
ncbi:hypothetical protein RJ640_010642 [Escallonia rubra]|uniref:NAC domain-containing protein n=1 Tax=Escallonia rubra TaxID=112253 RepID=A0AA88QAH3_9ASTE|nr:hypothetical protein RJ640_010642 [Escallonia rubra]